MDDDAAGSTSPPVEAPYSEWHEELRTVSLVATRGAGKHKVNMEEARVKMAALRQRSREHAAEAGSSIARVGEAVLLEAEAVIQQLDGRRLHEASCYEGAAAIWLDIERERRAVNEPTVGDGAYKALISTALACAALVGDAADTGDITMSVEAAIRDAAQQATSNDGSPREQPQSAGDSGAPGGGGDDGEEGDNKLKEKASKFFGGLKARLKTKAAEAKVKANEAKTHVQNAVSPQRARAPPDASPDGVTEAERQGRKPLPRYAVPHNFCHAQRVHASLARVADSMAVWGCREVAADTLELAAAFLTDEEAGVSKAQSDLLARASKAGEGRSVSPESPTGDVLARSTSDAALSGSAVVAGPALASPGGNAVLFGTATAQSGLPACRVPLRHLSRYVTTMRRAVSLRLALQQYALAQSLADDVLELLGPLLRHHADTLQADVSDSDEYSHGRRLKRELQGRSLVAGRPCLKYRSVVNGRGNLSTSRRLFGPAESAELRLVAAARVIAALLAGDDGASVRHYLDAFDALPTNALVINADADAADPAERVGLCPAARRASAALTLIGGLRAQANPPSVGGCSDGVAVAAGPMVNDFAVEEATAVVREALATPSDENFALALGRLPKNLCSDPLMWYLSAAPPKPARSDSPSPGRDDAAAASQRFIDPADLSP